MEEHTTGEIHIPIAHISKCEPGSHINVTNVTSYLDKNCHDVGILPTHDSTYIAEEGTYVHFSQLQYNK